VTYTSTENTIQCVPHNGYKTAVHIQPTPCWLLGVLRNSSIKNVLVTE